MINEIVNYVKENTFKLIYIPNKVNILNYGKILEIKDDVITLKKDGKLLFIRGKELKLQKLLNDEILITGKVKQIEL